MKYVIINTWEEDSSFGMVDTNDSDQIVIFPNGISHNVMVNALKTNNEDLKVVSAGFIKKEKDGRLFCYGNSSSLGVESRGDLDTILANINF